MEAERDTLTAEFSWFLDSEFKVKLAAIDKLMQECARTFSHCSSGVGDIRPVLLTSPHQGDTVLCTAAVDGDKIVKADINLKVPGRGSKPFHTTIKEHAPWKLKQIQDSANYFQQAMERYQEVLTTALTSPSQIYLAFTALTSCLRRSQRVLILPLPTTAHNIYTAEQKSHLKPELPEDVCVHFHISSAMLVLSILCVSHSNKQTSPATVTSQQSIQERETTTWVGNTFEHGSTCYEVTNQLQFRAQVPWLSQVSKRLQETLELSQDLLDKVKVFEVTE